MATFQITGPDGKKYRVEGENPEGAMQALRKMVDGGQAGVTAPPVQQQHPEFDGSNIPGYNPKTGMVEPQFSKARSAGYGAADTATMGFGDEMAAGVGTLIDKLPGGRGASYGEVLSEMRGLDTKAEQQNPKSYMGGQVAGAVAQALATRGAGLFPNATSVLGKAGAGAATGAAYGALHGAGSGDDAMDRIRQALIEGSIGGAAGGALSLAGQGISGAYQKGAEYFANKGVARSVGTDPDALRMLGQVMDADGTRGPAGQANMAAAGRDAMLADAGPNARAVLDTAIQRGGPGAIVARDRIAERTARGADDLVNALDTTLGSPQGVTATRTGIREGSAAARGAAYDAAYAAPIDYAQPAAREIEDILSTRVPGSAIKAANDLMKTEGVKSAQILADIADDGSVTFRSLPDVRQLDYITRGLKAVADEADGKGKLGGTTDIGRAYNNLSREIRDRLKGLVPEYAKALETAADPIRRSQAVELGSRLLSPAMRRDEVAEAVAGMSGAERAALAQGVRSQLDDLMANVTRTVQDGDTGAREAIKAIRDLSSRANREKLGLVLGDKAGPLFDEMDRVAKSFDLRASVAENSKTYARLATDRRVRDATDPGAMGKLVAGKPLNALQRIAQVLTGTTPENQVTKQDAVYSELAKLLTSPQSQAVFEAIGKIGKTDATTEAVKKQIVKALSPSLSYPLSAPAGERFR